MMTEPTLCGFCDKAPADGRSEYGYCLKCHFDIFDVNLDGEEYPEGGDYEDNSVDAGFWSE